jgi:hypothetical protein
MTKKTPSGAEAEGPASNRSEPAGSSTVHDQLRSLDGLRGRLIEKLFVPQSLEESWTSLPATN